MNKAHQDWINDAMIILNKAFTYDGIVEGCTVTDMMCGLNSPEFRNCSDIVIYFHEPDEARDFRAALNEIEAVQTENISNHDTFQQNGETKFEWRKWYIVTVSKPLEQDRFDFPILSVSALSMSHDQISIIPTLEKWTYLSLAQILQWHSRKETYFICGPFIPDEIECNDDVMIRQWNVINSVIDYYVKLGWRILDLPESYKKYLTPDNLQAIEAQNAKMSSDQAQASL